jgi:hypothetical protein
MVSSRWRDWRKMEAPGGLEPPIEILQTSALPLGDGALLENYDDRKMEREKGFEPSTSTLARLHSTTELLPLIFFYGMEDPKPIIFLQLKLSNSIF